MKQIGIYKITNPEGQVYIGQSKDLDKRYKNYLWGDWEKNRNLKRSVEKHGWDKHFFEIIIECEIFKLSELECYYISIYKTNVGVLNLSSGGSNPKYSNETKNLMSIQRKGVKPTLEALEKRRIGREKNRDKFLTAMRNPELLKKKSELSSKSILIIDGVKHSFFDSVIEASRYFNIHKSSLARYARGERLHKHLKIEYI